MKSRDWEVLIVRGTLAFIGAALGGLIVSVPMSMVEGNDPVGGWPLAFFAASTLVGAYVGWKALAWWD